MNNNLAQRDKKELVLGDMYQVALYPGSYWVQDANDYTKDITNILYYNGTKKLKKTPYPTGQLTSVFLNRVDNKLWCAIKTPVDNIEYSVPTTNILRCTTT